MPGFPRPSNWKLVASTVTVTIVLVEIVLRVFLPTFDPFDAYRHVDRRAYIPSQHSPGHMFRSRMEAGLPGMSGEATFSVNAMGFRGKELEPEKASNEFRVFMIGGSSMECAIIDDSRAPNVVVERTLVENLPSDRTFVVQNAGHSGDKSFDHVSLLAHRIAHLEPDAITVLAGVNELYASVQGLDMLHIKRHSPADYDTGLLMKLLLTNFEIPKRVWAASHPRIADVRQDVFTGGVFETNFKWAVDRCDSLPSADGPPPENLAFFDRNLASLVGIARAHGAEIVLVTQPSTWRTSDEVLRGWHWFRCIGDRKFDEALLEKALERHNAVTRAVAKRMNVRLVDLAAEIPPTSEFFMDDVHFNQRGSDYLADAIGRELIDLVKTSTRTRG